MDAGRAVERRKASPPVRPAIPLLTGSPEALFSTSRSGARSSTSTRAVNPEGIHPETHCRRAFLPGSAQNVECDVTSTKQTVGEFLPGARTPQFGSRMLSRGAQCRVLGEHSSAFLTGTALQTEIAVTRSKQTTASFLTGAKIDTLAFHLSLTETYSAAPTSRRFATLRCRRQTYSSGKGDFDAVPVRMDRSCWIERRGREARGCARWNRVGS